MDLSVDGTVSLKIARQPPSRTVYQRILKPFPSVMLLGATPANSQNMFIEAALYKADTDVELPSYLEGTKVVQVRSYLFIF